MPPNDRPEGITCPDWEPTVSDPQGRRCRHYNANGSCQLPIHLMCIEWLKRQPAAVAPAPCDSVAPSVLEILQAPERAERAAPGSRPQSPVRSPQGPRDSSDPEPLSLTAPEPKAAKASAKRETAAEAARRAFAVVARGGEVTLAPPPDYTPAKEIDPASLEALEKTGAEVELGCPPTMTIDPPLPIVLVPTRTGREDRHELTFGEAATLRMIVDCFPGAVVVGYRRQGPASLRSSAPLPPALAPLASVGPGKGDAPTGQPEAAVEEADTIPAVPIPAVPIPESTGGWDDA